jgi:putative phosphoesterase
MLVGVVSDTHGSMLYAPQAVRMLETFDIAALLHCGDIGSTEVARLFQRWPSHFVLGNCDHDGQAFTLALAEFGTYHQVFGDITLAQRRIALLHSHDAACFSRTCSSGEYDLVCYGHTHVAEQHRQGQTLVLNPGALYRTSRPSVAVVDLATLTAEIIPVA